MRRGWLGVWWGVSEESGGWRAKTARLGHGGAWDEMRLPWGAGAGAGGRGQGAGWVLG